MRCQFAACANRIVRDVDTDTVSLIDLAESTLVPMFPIVMPELACLFILQREEGDKREIDGMAVLTLSGEEIFKAPITINFNGKSRFRQILTLAGIVLPHPGVLKLALVVGDREQGSREIDVMSAAKPQLRLPLAPIAENEEGRPATGPTLEAYTDSR